MAWKRAVTWGAVAVAAIVGLAVLRAMRRPARPLDEVVWSGADAYGDPLPQGAVARLGTVRFRTTTPTDAVFLPSGTIVSGGFDDEIVEWDAAPGRRLRTLPGHRDRVLVPMRRYGLSEWKKALVDAEPPTYEDGLDGLVLSADGRTLVSYGNSIRVWDVAKWEQSRQVFVRGKVDWLAIAPDGSLLVSGSDDTTALVWDVAAALAGK